MKMVIYFLTILTISLLLGSCEPYEEIEPATENDNGKISEEDFIPVPGESFFKLRTVFSLGTQVREPYLAVAADGTILALRNRANFPYTTASHLRRSEDGGQTWGEIIEVPFGFLDTNFIIDENTGDILVVRMWDDINILWRSSDHGKSWHEEKITLIPNDVMNMLEDKGLKERVSWKDKGIGYGTRGRYTMHANASESGITLRHGEKKGRLIVSATFRPHAPEHPSDRDPVDAIYSTAIYSDNNGATWQISHLFPEGYTEEAALVELQDGRIYYNSRSCQGYHDKSLARELLPEETLRREAFSYDGGHTWEDLRVSQVLPDGGGYGRGYGLKGGLVRLPVKDRDILIFSNTDTGGGEREKMTVWASFDGGDTWPIKRLVYDGHSAYSSLGAGIPGTPGENSIYLLFEGGAGGVYSSMLVASFNLSWILEGESTGNGSVPEWIQ